MRTLLAIALLAITLPVLAAPIVSQTALNYSADQSVPPIATHQPTKISQHPTVRTEQLSKTIKHHKYSHKAKKHLKHHHSKPHTKIKKH